MLPRLPQLLQFNLSLYKALYGFSNTYSGDAVMSGISSATNGNEVLEHFRQNSGKYNHEHLVLTLRMIGRFASRTLWQDLQQDDNKQIFNQLSAMAEKHLGDFNLVDVLFWLRKTRSYRIHTGLSHDCVNTIVKRVNEGVHGNKYSFRNMVNIYYDLAMLNKSPDFLVEPMKRIILNEPTQVTPFISVQILQGASKRSKYITSRELILIDILLRQVSNHLSEIDLDQKSSIFKYIAGLELNFHLPHYRIPNVMFLIRQDVQSNVESLSEFAVLNVIQAYIDLPYTFPGDLIDEVKEMVNVTLKHNASNLKNNFLLDFTELILSLPKSRRIDEKRLNALLTEIQTRFQSGDLTSNYQNTEKLAKILYKVQNVPGEIVTTLFQATESAIRDFNTTQRMNYIPFVALEYLTLHEQPVLPLLQQIENPQLDRIYIHQRFRYLSILSRFDVLSQTKNQVVSSILERSERNPENIFSQFEKLYIPSEDVNKLIKTLGDRIRESASPQNINRLWKAIYLTVIDRESSQQWIEHLDKQIIDPRSIGRGIEEFELEPNQYTSDNVSFFLILISRHAKDVGLHRISGVLANNPKVCQEIARSDINLRKLLDAVRTHQEARPQETRLSDILSICVRLEEYVSRPELVKNLLRRCYDVSKSTRENFDSLHESAYISYMIKMGCLHEKDALQLVESQPRINDKTFRSRLLALAQQAPDSEKSSLLQSQVSSVIAELSQRLQDSKVNSQLTVLPLLLLFRPSSLTPHDATILKVLKDNQANLKHRLLAQIILAIPRVWMSKPNEREILNPIQRQLIDIFVQSKNQHMNDTLSVVEAFVELRTKATSVYNKILQDIGEAFDRMNAEQRVRSLRIFSRIGLRQVDLFQQMLTKMAESPRLFRSYTGDIAQSLYRVGLTEPDILEKYNTLHSAQHESVYQDSFTVISYYIICDRLDLCSALLSKVRLPKFLTNLNQTQLFIIEYLNRKKHQELLSKFQGLSSPQDYQSKFQRFLGTTQVPSIVQSMVGSLLSAMQIPFEANHNLNGLFVDFHIPSQKIAIVLIKTHEINQDGFTFSGDALFRQRIYETMPGYKFVFFTMQQLRMSGQNPSDKVNFLISLGLQANTTKFDFSQLPAELMSRSKPSTSRTKRSAATEEPEGEIDEEQREPL